LIALFILLRFSIRLRRRRRIEDRLGVGEKARSAFSRLAVKRGARRERFWRERRRTADEIGVESSEGAAPSGAERRPPATIRKRRPASKTENDEPERPIEGDEERATTSFTLSV
jgi:hypothetical protein